MSATDMAVLAWCMVGIVMSTRITGSTFRIDLRCPFNLAGFAKLVASGPIMWALLFVALIFGTKERL